MDIHDKIWLWIAAAVSMVMGSTLVINDTSAGWFLVILGICYFGASTRAGQKWAISKLDFARWGLIGVLLIALLLVAGVVAVILT